MNSLLIALAAIGALCGPRIDSGAEDPKVINCQIKMADCITTAERSMTAERALAKCIKEVK